MWQIIRAKPTTDRHVQCDDGKVIEFTRWELHSMEVPAVELCELEDVEVDELRARAA